jgi:hypothetical protein
MRLWPLVCHKDTGGFSPWMHRTTTPLPSRVRFVLGGSIGGKIIRVNRAFPQGTVPFFSRFACLLL